MNLFCGQDPIALGISNPQGDWDYDKFKAHLESCPVCKCGVIKIIGYIGSTRSAKKSAASRANGKLGGRPITKNKKG
jgi:hypothetical protein